MVTKSVNPGTPAAPKPDSATAITTIAMQDLFKTISKPNNNKKKIEILNNNKSLSPPQKLILEPRKLEGFLYQIFPNNPEMADSILNHGCHCRLLNSETEFRMLYGGETTVSELDGICKKWLTQRRCVLNTKYMSVKQEQQDNNCNSYEQMYEIDFDFEKDNYRCTNDKKSTDKNDNFNCNYLLCNIDLHFAQEIKDLLDDENYQSVSTEEPKCFNNKKLSNPFGPNIIKESFYNNKIRGMGKNIDKIKDTCCLSDLRMYGEVGQVGEMNSYDKCEYRREKDFYYYG